MITPEPLVTGVSIPILTLLAKFAKPENGPDPPKACAENAEKGVNKKANNATNFLMSKEKKTAFACILPERKRSIKVG